MSSMDRVDAALSIVEVLDRGARNEDSGFHLQNKQNTRQIQAHAKVGQNRYTPCNISLYSPAAHSNPLYNKPRGCTIYSTAISGLHIM